MSEIKYKIGCKKCGRYIEVDAKLGIMDNAKFQLGDLHEDVEKLCICNKAWEMRNKKRE